MDNTNTAIPDINTAFPEMPSTNALPDVDSAFPEKPAVKDNSLLRRVLSPVIRAVATESIEPVIGLKNSPVKSVLDAFGHSARENFNSSSLDLPDDVAQSMRDHGIYNDYAKGQSNVLKGMFEGLIVPTAVGAVKSLESLYAGVSGAATRIGEVTDTPALGRDLLLSLEAFPINFHNPAGLVSKAKINGVLDGEDVFMGTKQPTQSQIIDRRNYQPETYSPASVSAAYQKTANLENNIDGIASSPASVSNAIPSEATSAYQKTQNLVEVSNPPSVGKAARLAYPQQFNDYDLALARQDMFRRGIDNLDSDRKATIMDSSPFAEQKQALEAKVASAENKRKAKIAQDNLDKVNQSEQEWVKNQLTGDTPDMAKLRQEIIDLDLKRRDMGVEISGYTKEAENAVITRGDYDIPDAEWKSLADSGVVKVAEDGTETIKLSDYWNEKDARRKATESKVAQEDAAAKLPSEAKPSPWGEAVEQQPQAEAATIQPAPAVAIEVKPSVVKPNATKEPPVSDTPVQQPINPVDTSITAIVDDIQKQAVAAGYGAEEASASANIIARQYAYLARTYSGAKGSAEDLYRAYGLRVTNKTAAQEKSGRVTNQAANASKKIQGSYKAIIDDARGVIRLFQSADKSTLVHEGAHHFLDMMKKFNSEASVPAAFTNDMNTVKKWLKVKEDGVFTRAMEERFARGFEAYLMEGVAPSKDLAGIFAKFKEWLTEIYQGVKNIPSMSRGINNDIRSFFDKTLTSAVDNVKLSDDIDVGASASAHEADSFRTKDANAANVADSIGDDIYKTALTHDKEVADAIKSAETGGNAEEVANAQRNVDAAESASRANNPAEEPNTLNPSRGSAEAQGVEAPKKPESSGELIPKAESQFIDKAGNIRLDNLNTPDDINQLLKEVAGENDMFSTERRGVIPDADVALLADALGMDASKLSARKIGQAFSAEEIVAARKLLIESATDLRAIMDKARGGSEADVLAFAIAKERHIMIQGHVSGITAEAGRALRAFRAMDGMKDAEMLSEFLQKEAGVTIEELRQQASRGAALNTPQKVSKYINDTTKPRFRDKVQEYWINSILANVTTHAVNITGNSIVIINSIVETAAAAGIGKAIAKVTGKQSEAVHLIEAKARLFGITQGAVNGIKAASTILKDENAISGFHTVEYVKHRKAVGGTIGKIVRTPTRFLSAEDEIFKAIGYQQELNALAYRTASNEGLTGKAFDIRVAKIVQSPSEEIMEAAIKNAEYQTFVNKLGPTGAALQHFANSNVIAKFAIPFVRTPTNILKYATERTPVGFFFKEVRDNISGKNGAIARDTQLARMAIGTTIATAFGTMAVEGLVTGGGPSKANERSMLRLSGWQPYSVKIGNGYYSYQWLGPVGVMASVSADVAEIYKVSERDEKLDAAAFSTIAQNLMGRLSLRGASDLLQAISNPEIHGDNYIQRFAASFVPATVTPITQKVDPVFRETNGIIDEIKSRIPFASMNLTPKIDIWGNPLQRSYNLDSDIITSKMITLGYFPAAVSKKIRGVELTEKQHADFAILAGKTARLRVESAFSSGGFSSLPRYIQLKTISGIIDSSREAASSLILMKNPDIISKALDNKRKEISE